MTPPLILNKRHKLNNSKMLTNSRSDDVGFSIWTRAGCIRLQHLLFWSWSTNRFTSGHGRLRYTQPSTCHGAVFLVGACIASHTASHEGAAKTAQTRMIWDAYSTIPLASHVSSHLSRSHCPLTIPWTSTTFLLSKRPRNQLRALESVSDAELQEANLKPEIVTDCSNLTLKAQKLFLLSQCLLILLVLVPMCLCLQTVLLLFRSTQLMVRDHGPLLVSIKMFSFGVRWEQNLLFSAWGC